MSRTQLRRPKQGPCRARKCLARQIWSFFMPFEAPSYYWLDSKGSLSSVQVAFLDILSLMIIAFQTGHASYTTWMCLHYAIIYQNHSDAFQFQMLLMPFLAISMLLPFPVLPRTPLIPHNIFLCWFSRAIPRFFLGGSQASDFLGSLLNLLRPLASIDLLQFD